MICNLTFDIDMTDYFSRAPIDEISNHLDQILVLLDSFDICETTWFLRLDSDSASSYSSPTVFEQTMRHVIGKIRQNNHVVGWHHHPSVRAVDNEAVWLEELKFFGGLAQRAQLEISRMGFAQMTPRSLREIVSLGFTMDSSCISRPNYEWETFRFRDWSGAPNRPYKPCFNDPSTECHATESIWEVPITTVPMPFSSDTRPDVRRYLNLAYKPEIFKLGLDAWSNDTSNRGVLLTMTHPYETGGLHRFPFGDGLADVSSNLELILRRNIELVGMADLCVI